MPVVLVAARQGSGCDELAVTSSANSLPVLDGVPAFLRGVRALFDYRDFLACDADVPPAVSGSMSAGAGIGEQGALALLADHGLPVVQVESVSSGERPWPRHKRSATPWCSRLRRPVSCTSRSRAA